MRYNEVQLGDIVALDDEGKVCIVVSSDLAYKDGYTYFVFNLVQFSTVGDDFNIEHERIEAERLNLIARAHSRAYDLINMMLSEIRGLHNELGTTRELYKARGQVDGK